MRRRTYVISTILMLVVAFAPLWLPPTLQRIDDEMDLWADPSYNGPSMSPTYDGGRCWFYVDNDFPFSSIQVIMNSTSRSATFDPVPLSSHDEEWSDHQFGGKLAWKVKDVPFGPDEYEYWKIYYIWRIYNTSYWGESPVYVHEGYSWNIDINDGLYCPEFNLTLYIGWWGFI